MSSGFKNIQINTQERALSVDINRLQKFIGADIAEAFRYLLDVSGSADVTSGRIVEYSTVETPVRAEILGGLMVKPQIGSTSIQVDPGAVFMLTADGASDESNYKFIRDAGVVTNGVLSVAANASGSTRVDVIECQMNATNLVVQDSRDIFNATTGLFTASLVNKEVSGRLSYRVRQGTPGAGFPGTASGWLPLCVALVPNGSTNNDAVTFWDVRPLLADRDGTLFNRSTVTPRADQRWVGPNNTGGTYPKVKGYLDVTYNGRRVGGKLGIGIPGTDTDVVDFQTHLSAGYAITSGTAYYVYLAFPQGLPRWARYTDASSGSRQPRNPCGIPVVSHTAPSASRTPTVAINMPTAVAALGSATSEAVCVWSGFDVGAALNPVIVNGSRTVHGTNYQGVAISPTQTGTTPDLTTFRLIPGTHFPPHAKRLHLYVECLGHGMTPGTYTIPMEVSADIPGPGGTMPIDRTDVVEQTLGAVDAVAFENVDLIAPAFYPDATPAFFEVKFDCELGTKAGSTSTTFSMYVRGWEE